jgi:GNAT superfamily N-acetyltransferase
MVVRVERISLESAPVVQKIYDHSPTYFLKTDHQFAGSETAIQNMQDEVPLHRQSASYEKIFCLITLDGNPVGIVDLHKDHPQRGVTYVGLFLIDERIHKKGIGRACFQEVENFVNRHMSCSHLRLGVSEDNNVEGFWVKMGFVRNHRTYKWNAATRENVVFEMEKKL